MASIQKMPTAKQIQPMGLLGRLEAIRVPTMGKARKGSNKMSTALSPPVPPRARRLHGPGGELQRDARSTQDERKTGKRPGQPRGRTGAHPLYASPLSPRSLLS
jgi:hypothetical protein